MPGRWITYEQALDHLGVPESTLDAFIKAGLVSERGRAKGYRLNAEEVHAVGVLMRSLDGLVKGSEGADLPKSDK